jgi:hypothetical protein
LPASDGGKGTSNLAAQVENEFCCVFLTSLDGKEISQADRLLLTTTARATLSAFEWNADRKTIKSWGRAPTVIEPVRGAVTLLGLKAADSVVFTPLAAEGRPLEGAVRAEMSDSGWRIPIGTRATTWYLVEVEH